MIRRQSVLAAERQKSIIGEDPTQFWRARGSVASNATIRGGWLAAGFNFTLGLHKDGTFWAWGHNGNGQLGDGTILNRAEPIPILPTFKWFSPLAPDSH